jgi:5'-deoxynucleotidase YfbR-like HD superfamily hydrolase
MTRVPTQADTPRVFQRMRSGRRLHLLDPSPVDVEISDAIYGISRQMRWNGQTTGEVGFTVAQHSVTVEAIFTAMVWPKAPVEARLAALVHDLAEWVLSDLSTPVKAVIKAAGYGELEQRVDRAIRLRIGLPAVLPEAWIDPLKRADRIAGVTEAVRLAGWSEADARRDVGKGYRGKLWEGPLDPLPEAAARAQWLARFAALGGR